jgi:hypothetical protein
MKIRDWFYPVFYKSPRGGRYTELKATALLSTLEQLQQRIAERFPYSGLAQVCTEFFHTATELETVAVRLGRPLWPVRILGFLAAALVAGITFSGLGMLVRQFSMGTESLADLIQTIEAGVNEVIFLGIALFFLINFEVRLKRRVALRALHRLRSLAHVVDMHQLTKDPAWMLSDLPPTNASPIRSMNRYELVRYLDYCSELLALNSKVAALFAQNMDDPEVLRSVNDLESLTQGLSGKIWQKIMILDLAVERG